MRILENILVFAVLLKIAGLQHFSDLNWFLLIGAFIILMVAKFIRSVLQEAGAINEIKKDIAFTYLELRAKQIAAGLIRKNAKDAGNR